MKEALFVKQNIEKWKQAEFLVETEHVSTPDELAGAYIDVTADLAFAQTHYPGSKPERYLNNLAFALHSLIYRNRREKLSRIGRFWAREVPLAVYGARRELAWSLVIFLVSVLIGVVSTLGDDGFPRIILGSDYVEMTLDNIAKGRPVDVYGLEAEATSFLSITLNNVLVSFRAFAMGMLTSLGTGYILLRNGIMVGAFQTMMAVNGVGWESALALWLHGTLEISAIIVAGAAGICLGNGWLFPGTYSRLTSLMRGARRGLKILVGTVPIFIVAGFIEGFFTRHTEWPDALRLAIILASLAFILYYYVWLPREVARRE